MVYGQAVTQSLIQNGVQTSGHLVQGPLPRLDDTDEWVSAGACSLCPELRISTGLTWETADEMAVAREPFQIFYLPPSQK